MVAYYAHSQGFGHCSAAERFCERFPKQALVLTASNYNFNSSVKVMRIPNEDCEVKHYASMTDNLPKYAHYLPKSQRNLLLRNAKILNTCVERKINFAMVDVSVETAIQFRVAGIPYAYHKMMGKRTDEAHQIAFGAAEFLFARYPKQLNFNNAAFTNKTQYLGFVSRYEYRENTSTFIRKPHHNTAVLIVAGKGGSSINKELIEKLVLQMPECRFTVIGIQCNANKSANIKYVPFTKTLDTIVLEHDVVISSCGLNLTAELLALKNKFIAVPEKRPYQEQEYICEALVSLGLAVRLDANNFVETMETYNHLEIAEDLPSYFGTMENLASRNELKNML